MKTQYILVKGMLSHPFSDQSGVAFYNPFSTDVVSIGMNHETISEVFQCVREDNPSAQAVIEELLAKGFICLKDDGIE
ncbi:hypothetical protein PN836_007485 [Ningiella sp. W23]|uniref:hypothetical protein n=1 Tax=Ningiella sp. W23 TaxID=3023715 RepID=UPI003756E7CC